MALTFTTVIQGNADVSGSKLTQGELNDTVDFCLHAYEHHDMEKTKKVHAELAKSGNKDPTGLDEDEMKILRSIRARQLIRSDDFLNNDNFGIDTIDGYRPQIKKGGLTILKAEVNGMKSATFDLGTAMDQKQAHETVKEVTIDAN